MDFTLTPEQQLLSDGLDKFLDARYDLQVSRDAAKVGEGWQPKIWKAFVEDLGVVDDVGGEGDGVAVAGVLHGVLRELEDGLGDPLGLRRRRGRVDVRGQPSQRVQVFVEIARVTHRRCRVSPGR